MIPEFIFHALLFFYIHKKLDSSPLSPSFDFFLQVWYPKILQYFRHQVAHYDPFQITPVEFVAISSGTSMLTPLWVITARKWDSNVVHCRRNLDLSLRSHYYVHSKRKWKRTSNLMNRLYLSTILKCSDYLISILTLPVENLRLVMVLESEHIR